MKRLEISCMGPPLVRVDGQTPPAEVLWRKHLALLVYLALSPAGSRTRSHLMGLLWPEKSGEQARHSLNEALRRLRACLGGERLMSEGEAVALSGEDLDVDVASFREAASRDPARASALLKGDFLEGLALEDAPPFEEWVAGERTRFRQAAVDVLVRAGERLLEAGEPGAALHSAQRALAVDPYSEPAIGLAMRAAALGGDGTGALAAYHEFTRRLVADTGEEPSRDLAALAARIREARWRGAPTGHEDDEPRLVGRGAAHAAAFALLARGVCSGPQTLLITGDPGMGKSRLLAECAARLRLDGAVVASAHPLECDADVRWSTLRQLMRGGLLAAPGLAAADPEALGSLASLVPALAERVAPHKVRDVAQVAAALQSLLAAVADEQPLGLAVDDLQHADEASLDALGAALAALSGVRLAVIGTAPAEADTRSRGLLRLRSAVGRSLPGLLLRLDPLGDDEILELVAATGPRLDGPQLERLARRIGHESGGSPFFALTLLRALRTDSVVSDQLLCWPPPQRTYDAPLPFSVPDLVRMAILVRVADLEVESRRLLIAASVTGHVLDLDLVAALSELPAEEAERRLADLEGRHLVQWRGERYTFVAPLIAEVLRRECLTRGRLRSLRSAAIAHLARRTDLESRVLKAELAAASEPGVPAFEEAVAVTREAAAAGARRLAARAIAAARQASAAAAITNAIPADLEAMLAEHDRGECEWSGRLAAPAPRAAGTEPSLTGGTAASTTDTPDS